MSLGRPFPVSQAQTDLNRAQTDLNASKLRTPHFAYRSGTTIVQSFGFVQYADFDVAGFPRRARRVRRQVSSVLGISPSRPPGRAIGRIRLALDAERCGGGLPGFPVGHWGSYEHVCAGFERLAAETACETEAVSASQATAREAAAQRD
jgi:hypothetical protein